MPDTIDHTQGVSARVVSNAIENSATIKYRNDKNIDVHIEAVEGKGTIYELVYTPIGQNSTTTIKITKGSTNWKNDDRNKLFKDFRPVLGNIIIDTAKMDADKGFSIKTTKKDGTVLESYVSDKFNFDKSQEKFEGLVFTDNSESLGSILVNKSLYTPYARIFTNDYVDSDQKDVYDAYDIKPVNKNSFMTNTASIKAYSSYEGSPATMRYIPLEGDIYYQTVSSIENPRDKDGFETDDKSRSISVPESERDPVNKQTKTYNKYQFDMPLNKFTKVIGPDNELADQTNIRYASDKDYSANGFSEKSGAQKLEKKYTQNVIDAKGNITQMEAQLSNAELELRKWPEKPAAITTASGETKEFLGWATKKVTAEEFAKLTELKTVEQWATATTTGYKVTEDSPFDSHQVLYAVYGEGASAVFNPKQKYDEATDKQYIEGTLKSGETQPTDPNTDYKLVQKDSDGKYTEVNVPVTKDGDKITFDVKNENIVHDGEYYIAVTEPGKATSYSDNPVKVDKQGPTLGTSGNEITLVQDHYGYQVKISAEAKDDAGILRVYAEDDKANGYYKADANEKTANLNGSIQQQEGVEKTFKVTAVDKFGNKTEATQKVEKKAEPLSLKAERPLDGDDFIFVTTSTGANLEIKVIKRDKSEVSLKSQTQTEETSEIKLLNADGSAFTLEKGQKVKITASKDGQTATLTIRVR